MTLFSIGFTDDSDENTHLYVSEKTYNVQRTKTKENCKDLQKNYDSKFSTVTLSYFVYSLYIYVIRSASRVLGFNDS